MKKVFTLAVVALLFMSAGLSSSPVGTWKTIDDETGKEKSYVVIWEKNGQLYARIDKLLLKEDQGKLCEECEGEKYNKPVQGMQIMWGVSATKDSKGQYSGGNILDPKNGKIYSVYLQ